MNNEYSADPIEQLRAWLDTDVVALATATSTGAPSLRMVLLKGADERGLLFFTNYEGRKGRELAENPQAAMLFHLDGRQIRVEGRVEKVDPAESDIYWEKRPRESQISAWVSRQSEPIESREELDRRFARVRRGPSRGARPPAALGRLSPLPGELRVLGAPRQPPPRSRSLPPRGQRLGGRTAAALAAHVQQKFFTPGRDLG